MLAKTSSQTTPSTITPSSYASFLSLPFKPNTPIWHPQPRRQPDEPPKPSCQPRQQPSPQGRLRGSRKPKPRPHCPPYYSYYHHHHHQGKAPSAQSRYDPRCSQHPPPRCYHQMEAVRRPWRSSRPAPERRSRPSSPSSCTGGPPSRGRAPPAGSRSPDTASGPSWRGCCAARCCSCVLRRARRLRR